MSLAPFRALRPTADTDRLGRLLCPPYDVIDAELRATLLADDSANAVGVILPEPTPDGYAAAARRLADEVANGLYASDESAALFVYEMRDPSGHATRGLLGALELRAPEDGVILPHENTMAGPVADRLAVMTATGTDLEPIYLVYDGGGAASDLVRHASDDTPVALAVTRDGVEHRLWRVAEAAALAAVAQDLTTRRALIADGHHRYATYRERQRLGREATGPGPWDRGLALLVDSTDYGPQVHAIHRVVNDVSLAEALSRLGDLDVTVFERRSPEDALADLPVGPAFAAVLTNSVRTFVLEDAKGTLAQLARRTDDPPELAGLDVSVLHRGLVERVWQLADNVDTVHYAHSLGEALRAALASDGFAVLLRPTPVQAVAAVAAAGARMPRKSTLFTPKPASGLVMRRLADQLS